MNRFVLGILIVLFGMPVAADRQTSTPGGQRTQGLTRLDGFIPMYLDTTRGRLLFDSPPLGQDVLYYISFATSPGSVEIGMDRGVINLSRTPMPGEDASQAVIRFERAGSKILVVQRNPRYRALGGPEALAQNIEDSFAQSVLASLPVDSEDGGRLLVDATPLFMRDAAYVERRLRQRDEGTFRFDANRSAFYAARTKAFPKNSEVEITATYTGDNPGFNVSAVTPDPSALTLRIHHSFLQAPTGYRPRAGDPRVGFYVYPFKDYSTSFDRSPETRWITRWRLEKKDPAAAVSEPKTPIVFYLDPAIPEPARGAARRGVLWWNKAFELAGFKDAVQVKDPTPDMDPMDIRYAWLLWVNRDERGFSSSGQYIDPRTGEVLGAKVHLDSARIRTMGEYWDAYQPTGSGGGGAAEEAELLEDFQTAGVATSGGGTNLMLMRQALLAAHEVGHTFGVDHNYNGSLNNRSSVMEYPTPRITVTADKRLDVSDAFQTDIGEYDTYAIRFAYTDFPADKEATGLDRIITEMHGKGLLFTPQTDPRWTAYDDLPTPTENLRDTMAARAIMLEHYGPAILKAGEPIGDLRDMRLWMTYLHHRWAIESALKYVGGMYHEYAVKGEANVTPTQIVPAALQREVLTVLMQAVQPANLAIPERLLAALTPPPYGQLEDLGSGYAFDQLRAARILSASVIEQLLQPDRAARLVAFADRQANALTLPEVVTAILQNTWESPRDQDPAFRSLRRVTERVALDSLMVLGANAQTTPEVRAYVVQRLGALGAALAPRHDADPLTEAHIRQAEQDIAHYVSNPAAFAPKSVMPLWGARPRPRYPAPPGPPLGF